MDELIYKLQKLTPWATGLSLLSELVFSIIPISITLLLLLLIWNPVKPVRKIQRVATPLTPQTDAAQITSINTDTTSTSPTINSLDPLDEQLAKKAIKICWKRSIFTETYVELDREDVFNSISDCRISIEQLIPQIKNDPVSDYVLNVFTCLDGIEGKREDMDANASIDSFKLGAIKNLRDLVKRVNSKYDIPRNLTEEIFFNRSDADKPPTLR